MPLRVRVAEAVSLHIMSVPWEKAKTETLGKDFGLPAGRSTRDKMIESLKDVEMTGCKSIYKLVLGFL